MTCEFVKKAGSKVPLRSRRRKARKAGGRTW